LLLHHGERRAEAHRDRVGCQPFIGVQLAQHRTRQQELAREEVHLHLTSLARPVVKDAIDPDRRILHRSVGLDVHRHHVQRATFQHDMTEFMCDQEGALEVRSAILVEDASRLTVEGGFASLEL
jgi:hypothetical protein